MIVADARKCSEYLQTFWKTTQKQLWRLIKKYVDYYTDQETKLRRFSQKSLDRTVKLIITYEDKVRWKSYTKAKDDLLMLIKYKAKEQIYLQLKNKEC